MRYFSAKKSPRGFTIVELLVVIVVIGILAAITIISYSGITNRATVASLQSDLENASKMLKIDQVNNGAFPATLAAANGGKGIVASSGTTIDYAVDNPSNPTAFCMTATNNGIVYKISDSSTPAQGDCLDFALRARLDAGNPASYPGTGTTWTDLSGNNNNGTLVNGVGYNSSNGGSLTFDGTSNYVNAGNTATMNTPNALTVIAWVNFGYLDYSGSTGNLYTIASKGRPDSLSPTTGWWFGYDNRNNRKSFAYTCFGNSSGGYSGGGNNFAPNVTSPSMNASTWYQLAFTVNSSEARLYMNGTQQGATRTMSNLALSNTISNFYVGIPDGGSTNFRGNIARIDVYGRVLSPNEVMSAFNNLRSRFGL